MITEVGTKSLTLVQAVNDALRIMLKEREDVIVLGEDVGKNGGVFRATDGLLEEFGEQRVIDTPLSEAGFTGAAIGMALGGFRPVVEIQFLGFILIRREDSHFNEAKRSKWEMNRLNYILLKIG
ncbi:hypothetical protein P9743_16630 [Anoxybacillus geothermalis]|nr:hypothetical protein [Anoxybacillus geothermalis]